MKQEARRVRCCNVELVALFFKAVLMSLKINIVVLKLLMLFTNIE